MADKVEIEICVCLEKKEAITAIVKMGLRLQCISITEIIQEDDA